MVVVHPPQVVPPLRSLPILVVVVVVVIPPVDRPQPYPIVTLPSSTGHHNRVTTMDLPPLRVAHHFLVPVNSVVVIGVGPLPPCPTMGIEEVVAPHLLLARISAVVVVLE